MNSLYLEGYKEMKKIMNLVKEIGPTMIYS